MASPLQTIRILAIIAASTWLIMLPIYTYGALLFWRHRHHMIISKRFPLLCASIISLSFISGTSLLCTLWREYLARQVTQISITAAFAFLTYGLLNTRLLLIYHRCSHNQRLLASLDLAVPSYNSQPIGLSMSESNQSIDSQSVTSVDIASSPILGQQRRSRWSAYSHSSTLCMLVFSLIGFALILSMPPWHALNGMLTGSVWTLHIVLTIILMLIIAVRRVNDGIGCLRETLLNLALVLLVGSFAVLLLIGQALFVPVYVVFIFGAYLQGLLPLYTALYYVYKFDSCAQRMAANTQLRRTQSLNEMQRPLPVFLQKYENYKLFRRYLSHCWALENLLFVQKVSILSHVVMPYHYQQQESNAPSSPIEACEFVYLSSIYNAYNERLRHLVERSSAMTADSNVMDEEAKEQLFAVCKEIYFEFVSDAAVTQINIAADVRATLEHLFEGEESARNLQSVDEYLKVFDPAAMETYELLLSLYSYNFKLFVESLSNEHQISSAAV